MDAQDPRHGSPAGRKKHTKDGETPCEPCKAAAAKYQNLRELDTMRGQPRIVSPIGVQRRIQALVSIGYSYPTLAPELGVSAAQVSKWSKDLAFVRSSTADRVAETYDSLSMTPLTDTRNAKYARTIARRNGWLPPLAWQNIDDPDEQPTDWQYRAPDRREQLVDLVATDAGISAACQQLGVTRHALERWCERNDCRDLYVTLCSREHVQQEYRNGYSREAS